MDSLITRFCRYVQINTQAGENKETYPSSPGQLQLGKLLVQELLELGIQDARQDEYGLVYATIPATDPKAKYVLAFVAHMDTAPDASGDGVKPAVLRNYDGNDIVLVGDPTKVLRVSENPELSTAIGRTIITTDGTTLLGGDDKAGVTIIMETAAYLLAHPEIPHGPIRILFTCDEEIGHGIIHVDLERLGAHVAYTLDGGGIGDVDCETFSADHVSIKVTGISSHPGSAKGKMVNAVRVASAIIDRLPREKLSPESTEDREGFIHPNSLEAVLGEATISLLLRDFETEKLREKESYLRNVLDKVKKDFPGAGIEMTVTKQYRNMAEGLKKEPRAVELAEQAMRKLGIDARRTIVRGGTDGSRLTELGLPTPNLSSGQHNLHSVYEWACADEMEAACRVLVELAQLWGRE